MVYNVYSVLDVNVGYSAPICHDNDAVAMRFFENACSDKHSIWYTHSSDFSLMRIGTFDTGTGEFTSTPVAKVCNAFDFVSRMKGEDYND